MGLRYAFICYSLFRLLSSRLLSSRLLSSRLLSSRLLSSRLLLSPVVSAMGIELGREGASISVSLSMLERNSKFLLLSDRFSPGKN
jgi:H+/Cl- antiporter ClcA